MPTSTARSTQFLLERFSPKQIRSIAAATRRINLWEGAVSSGKTIASAWAWMMFVPRASTTGELVMIGKTRDSLYRNVLQPLMNPEIFGELAAQVEYTPGAPTCRIFGRLVFLANRNANQSISSGGDTSANALKWDAVDLDVLGGWKVGQPTRWTAPRAGWWTFQGAVGFNSSTGGTVRECCWYVNGGLISMGRSHPINMSSIASGALTVDARSIPRLMAVGDYVELVAGQNSGSALDTATGSYRPYISITYSGPP